MIEFVSSDHGEFSPEFVQNEIVCSITVIVIKDYGMTQVLGVRLKIRNRKNGSNGISSVDVNMLAKKNRGFLQIWYLSRSIAILIKNVFDCSCLL